jgi:hypothetical protein
MVDASHTRMSSSSSVGRYRRIIAEPYLASIEELSSETEVEEC